MESPKTFDSLLFLSFGGPEGPADVMPFLENVTRGRGIPPERLAEVALHYGRFGGVSPINGQNRAIIERLEVALNERGHALPVYFGNRNWHPLLPSTVQKMASEGRKNALVFATSAFGSYSGCRQYRENLDEAAKEVEGAPTFTKLRHFYDHPTFVEIMADSIRNAVAPMNAAGPVRVVFTAHSIPTSMTHGSPYVAQLEESARLIASRLVGSQLIENQLIENQWDLVWQSRSGPPQVPWLEPDISDHLTQLKERGTKSVCVVPLGFLSDHMEVVWDLDHQAKDKAAELGLAFSRASTASTDERFAGLLVELIEEQLVLRPKRALGVLWETSKCGTDACCPKPAARPGRPG